MSIAFGMYTEVSASSPSQVFERMLSIVYKPVLSFMYNNPGKRLSMYQSVAMMKAGTETARI